MPKISEKNRVSPSDGGGLACSDGGLQPPSPPLAPPLPTSTSNSLTNYVEVQLLVYIENIQPLFSLFLLRDLN